VPRLFSDLLAIMGTALPSVSGTEPIGCRGAAATWIASRVESDRDGSAAAIALERAKSQRCAVEIESGEASGTGSKPAIGISALGTPTAGVHERST